MIPNVKKTIDQLKLDFSEDAPQRITPKILRDFLVSCYGSRAVDIITDSQDLDVSHDMVVVGFDSPGNYIRLPRSFANDDSGTPFAFKFYTVINPSVFGARVLTHPDDSFHTTDQEILLTPGATANIFAFNGSWYFYSGGTTQGGSGSATLPVRVPATVEVHEDAAIDSVVATNHAIRWLVHLIGATSGDMRTSEVAVNIKPNVDPRFVEYAVVGDELAGVTVDVFKNGANIELRVDNQSAEVVNSIVVRTVLA